MQNAVSVGQMCELEVVDLTDQGAFVDAKEIGSLFVPRKQLPKDLKLGDLLKVFLYIDGGRVLATARHPYLQLGQIGRLKVTSIDCGTVYLDLGIPKELVLPVSEQRGAYEVGRSVVIYVAQDDQGRLFATQRFNRYIEDFAKKGQFTKGQKVTLVPLSHTPLGYRTVVDDVVYGLIYKTNQKGQITIGKRYDGYILNVRDDLRLDVTLQELGRSGDEHAALEILKILKTSEGHLPFNDKTSAQTIEDYLHMSKGRFKKAIGALYKARLIEIKDDGIVLTELGASHDGQDLAKVFDAPK